MAAAVEATSQPLTQPSPSVPTTTTTNMTDSTLSTSPARRSNSENNGSRRPSGASSNTKHSKRHSNKPILVWLQRKIGGHKDSAKKQQASGLANATNTLPTESTSSSASADKNGQTVRGSRKHTQNGSTGVDSLHRSVHAVSQRADSLRPESAWGLTLEPEADDDASIRPLPPTSPPSPVPSRTTHDSGQTSGGYTAHTDGRSARTPGTPSTKPTTIMSVDMGPGGHIAQVPSISSSIMGLGRGQFAGPPTPNPVGGSPVSGRFPVVRGAAAAAAASVSFSPLSQNTSRSNTPASLAVPSTSSAVPKLAIHIPGHSHLHPRNNPRPASPPMDNASTLTLASSTFAVSRASPRSRSMAAEREREFDATASVRALRPSSRRGSWGSDETGWSAAALSTQTGLSSAGPMMLGFGAGLGSTGGWHRRRGPGSIATAGSVWSYRPGGKESIGDGLDNSMFAGDDVGDDDEDEEDGASMEAYPKDGEELTPTEEVGMDFVSSPTSGQALPQEIPLPPSPELTPTNLE
ncbi:hypothetical protein DL93DRAFT_1719182 [Clavulina sp. PMI_390]|nr:hypothetical protein DL93DRAFT_1719182 [Clavulina sp. PMI_390]